MTPECVHTFRQSAIRYCALVEGEGISELLPFLRALQEPLPLLYLQALSLTWEEDSDEDVPSCVLYRQHEEIHSRPQEELDRHNTYWHLVAPRDANDPEPSCISLLSDDLTDIHRNLKEGLAHWKEDDPTTQGDAAWHWRETFGFHWSDHLLGALCALNASLEHGELWSRENYGLWSKLICRACGISRISGQFQFLSGLHWELEQLSAERRTQSARPTGFGNDLDPPGHACHARGRHQKGPLRAERRERTVIPVARNGGKHFDDASVAL